MVRGSCFTERDVEQSMDAHPDIAAWPQRVRSRAAYARTMELAAPKVQSVLTFIERRQ